MGITVKERKERREKIKEMYEKGMNLFDIAESFGVSVLTVTNDLSLAGIRVRKERAMNESNLVYADNSVELEKVVIDGKTYTDITPIFAPR